MADSQPSTSASPVARSTKPASEALLNDKVLDSRNGITTMSGLAECLGCRWSNNGELCWLPRCLLVGSCYFFAPYPVISRSLVRRCVFGTFIQTKSLACVGGIRFWSRKSLGRSWRYADSREPQHYISNLPQLHSKEVTHPPKEKGFDLWGRRKCGSCTQPFAFSRSIT